MKIYIDARITPKPVNFATRYNPVRRSFKALSGGSVLLVDQKLQDHLEKLTSLLIASKASGTITYQVVLIMANI